LKVIIFLSFFSVLAWYGLNQYDNNQERLTEDSTSYTESIEYPKCTTTDGSVIYGQPPVGTKCKNSEIVKSTIIIVPTQKLDSTNSVGKSSLATENYRCDGRVYCSQMTSREEAEFFSNNCSNTKMDGDRDGVPCENDSRF
jgi:hypothetical protein